MKVFVRLCKLCGSLFDEASELSFSGSKLVDAKTPDGEEHESDRGDREC